MHGFAAGPKWAALDAATSRAVAPEPGDAASFPQRHFPHALLGGIGYR